MDFPKSKTKKRRVLSVRLAFSDVDQVWADAQRARPCWVGGCECSRRVLFLASEPTCRPMPLCTGPVSLRAATFCLNWLSQGMHCRSSAVVGLA